ncbi:hypothetical protein L195_g044026 [Trifolium pratense]|uniref:Uncharacterized protein n=1 Tax=Trifolium pratense TaxID=57577 RepID=A0A2K3MAW5_TRIPR|nr:hypothetical protein L195_g044026 [Trifolium pratense]
MKDEDEDTEVVDNNTEKLKVVGIFPTYLNHVSTNISPVPTPQTPIWTPIAISPTVEHEEGHQMQLDNHLLASTTVPPKSQETVEQIQGNYGNLQRQQNCTQKTPSLAATTLNKDISIESTPVFSDNTKNSQSDFLQTLTISTTHNFVLDFQVASLYPPSV